MTVYVVQNSNDLLMAVFKTRAKAKRFINTIGKKRWEENWHLTPIKLGEVEAWISAGGDDYRAARRRLGKK